MPSDSTDKPIREKQVPMQDEPKKSTKKVKK